LHRLLQDRGVYPRRRGHYGRHPRPGSKSQRGRRTLGRGSPSGTGRTGVGPMREFDYHAPAATAEALDLLQRYGDDGHAMAGGASLLLMMQQGLITAGHIVGLRGIKEMNGISALPDGGIEIRSLTTHRQAERSSDVRSYCQTLAENFSRVATVRIRNQGTVGGNLAHADPAQDPPPMLMALDGEAVIAGKSGQRTVSLDGFFRDFFETAIADG